LCLDELFSGATNFSVAYKQFDTFPMSQRLLEHWKSRYEKLGPGDEYELVDEFADIVGLRGWYEWVPDTGASRPASPTTGEKPEGTTNPKLLQTKHSAAVWHLLDALQRYEQLPLDKIKQIALEIALLGRSGLDYADAEKKYQLKNLPGESFSGLQLMCLMFAAFNRFAPEHDVGMDLNEPFLVALQMFNKRDPQT
jgi:hypothetical protein